MHLQKKKAIGKKLVFRRHGKTKRYFVVQRIENLFVSETIGERFCSCRKCDGGVKTKSQLTIKDFSLFGHFKEDDK